MFNLNNNKLKRNNLKRNKEIFLLKYIYHLCKNMNKQSLSNNQIQLKKIFNKMNRLRIKKIMKFKLLIAKAMKKNNKFKKRKKSNKCHKKHKQHKNLSLNCLMRKLKN